MSGVPHLPFFCPPCRPKHCHCPGALHVTCSLPPVLFKAYAVGVHEFCVYNAPYGNPATVVMRVVSGDPLSPHLEGKTKVRASPPLLYPSAPALAGAQSLLSAPPVSGLYLMVPSY